jgi:glutaredoxin-related protein
MVFLPQKAHKKSKSNNVFLPRIALIPTNFLKSIISSSIIFCLFLTAKCAKVYAKFTKLKANYNCGISVFKSLLSLRLFFFHKDSQRFFTKDTKVSCRELHELARIF